MSDPVVLAKELRGVDDIQAALRARALDLKIVFDARTRHGDPQGRDRSLDSVAGLPTGYAAKLLSPVPLKSFGRTSLGPMLTALGVELWLVVDHAALMQITSRIERDPHRNGNAGGGLRAMKGRRKYTKLGSEWGRLMQARQFLLTPEGERKRNAKRAANVRWKKPVIVEIVRPSVAKASPPAPGSKRRRPNAGNAVAKARARPR